MDPDSTGSGAVRLNLNSRAYEAIRLGLTPWDLSFELEYSPDVNDPNADIDGIKGMDGRDGRDGNDGRAYWDPASPWIWPPDPYDPDPVDPRIDVNDYRGLDGLRGGDGASVYGAVMYFDANSSPVLSNITIENCAAIAGDAGSGGQGQRGRDGQDARRSGRPGRPGRRHGHKRRGRWARR